MELSQLATLTAFFVACATVVIPLLGARHGWTRWMRFASSGMILQFMLIGFAFAGLTAAFVSSDFSVKLVADHSHSLKPLLYKVTGVWGNHEGSLLLWVLTLVFCGSLVALFDHGLPLDLKARVLAVQSLITAAFLGFLILTSNPFGRLLAPPLDGNDLNPLLQDPGLAFHPPFLYLGYVGLSLTYSFAIAALIGGRVDAAWARWVRPWTLFAWVWLTIGIALGSWWAYYELGWGGWWFWDPVENASFMPWLAATALLHSAIVTEKRNLLMNWTILLAILAFSLTLIGTFIVRSGVLTSVHAFADDPHRGIFILAILTVATCGGFTLFALRSGATGGSTGFSTFSRESSLILNNLLLCAAAFVVFVGTIWPLVAELVWERKLSVGPPFFDQAFTPFMVVLAAVLPLGASLPWKRGNLRNSMKRLRGVLALSLSLGSLVWVVQSDGRMLAPVGVALAAWLIMSSARELLIGVRIRTPARVFSSLRLNRHPRRVWGKSLAHAGLGVTLFGISAITAWESVDIRLAEPGDTFDVANYEFHFRDVRQEVGPNYVSVAGVFDVSRSGSPVTSLAPEKRTYLVSGSQTTEAAIDVGFSRDLYLVLGERRDGGSWVVRTYVKPFAVWIWAGAAIMALGGLLSLSDRRLRVGIGRHRSSKNSQEIAAT